MNYPRLIGKIVLIYSVFCQPLMTAFSFDFIRSYFSRKQHKQIIQKELDVTLPATLTIHNQHGAITINEWQKPSLQLKATKRAPKPELLNELSIQVNKTSNAITIATKKKPAASKVTVDFELIIPKSMKVNAATEQGTISIHNISAPLTASTNRGDLEIRNTKSAVTATTQRGSILIANASGPIQANTVNGNITIENASKSVSAQTKKGTICTSCKKVRSLDTISLSADSGNIALALPKQVNADVRARTARGKLVSEHFITLKPQTLKLDKHAWARFRKEVNGTLGTGEATIKLNTKRGNIKITKTT